VSAERPAPFAPLVGALIGALGGAAYWLAAQIWPSSVAVILCMALTAWLVSRRQNVLPVISPVTGFDFTCRFFCLFIKYNALMALSAAKLPFAVPANVPLGLIMLCAYAASFALTLAPKLGGGGTLSIALLLGLAPAAILGIPGLSGLVAAIAVSLGVVAFFKLKGAKAADDMLGLTQLLSETGFYLGALATWSYI
jgi:adenosylcobinamide-GDP ribazoletransferase